MRLVVASQMYATKDTSTCRCCGRGFGAALPRALAAPLRTRIARCDSAVPYPSLCAAGSYSDADSTAECIPCTAGEYQADQGQTACETCTAGGYCSTGAVAPTLCSAGTYSASQGNSGQEDCSDCPTGSFCATGSTSPSDCATGTYADSEGAASCTACEAGTYQDVEGNTTCKRCTPGCARSRRIERVRGGSCADCVRSAALRAQTTAPRARRRRCHVRAARRWTRRSR